MIIVIFLQDKEIEEIDLFARETSYLLDFMSKL